MFESVDAALAYIREKRIDLVDLKIGGLSGEWRHITVPAREITPVFFKEGVGFDGSSVRGMGNTEHGDLAAVPDPAAAFVDPFYAVPTLSFICDIVSADGQRAFPRDPRGVARRAEAYLARTRIADRAVFAPEFEFYVFDRVAVRNDAMRVSVEIDAGESDGAGGAAISPGGGYACAPPSDRLAALRSEITVELEKLAVPVHYHHHEVGPAGQCEIETSLLTLTRAADQAMLIKYVIKNVAARHGKVATFMPKPMHGQAGNGMHVHQRLENRAGPLFFDAAPGRYAQLSDTALGYIAGLLSHGPALTGLTNPSTNSYKRLVDGYEAPVSLFFSLANRSAAIRVPGYATRPEEKRIEYRPPDFTGNVYLTLAAMLLAGLDGVARRIDPKAAGFGPYDVDIARADEALRQRVRPIPASVEQAMAALSEGRGVLTATEVFSDDLINAWIDLRLLRDAREVGLRPHPYEFALYLDA